MGGVLSPHGFQYSGARNGFYREVKFVKTLLMKRSVLAYYILAFLISWVLWLSPVLDSNKTPVPSILLLQGQFALLGPAIAGFILLIAEQGKTGAQALLESAWSWKFRKIRLLPTLFPPALIIAITLLIILPVKGQSLTMDSTPMPLPLFAVFIFFAGDPLEEFGWRGYALPKLLKKFAFVPARLIL